MTRQTPPEATDCSARHDSGHTPDLGFDERRTDRLVIRRLRAQDASTLCAYRSEPTVARYQSWDTPFTLTQAHAFIDGLSATDPDTPGQWFQFALVEAATGIHIGDVAAGVDADDPRLATIGVTLATSAQGSGYASEALAWLLDYLFLERGKHRVAADCDVRNDRVIALLERLQMRREANHLESAWWKGEWVDEYVYALLAQEWIAHRSPDGGARSSGR